MIGLALVMMRVRRAHAITIFLLGTLAIAAAVAPSVYVRIAQRSVAAVDVATATPAQRTIVVGSVVVVRADPGDPDSQRLLANSRVRAFDRKVSDALRIPGFDTVFTVSVPVTAAADAAGLAGPEEGTVAEPEQPLEFRHGFCEHVVVVAGRCAAGRGEVIVGANQARQAGLRAGGILVVQAADLVSFDGIPRWIPVGEAATLSVVGVYHVADAADPFWTATQSGANGRTVEPLLAERGTVSAVDHPEENQRIIAYPRDATLAADQLSEHRGDIERALQDATTAAGSAPVTAIVELLDRIDADRRQAAQAPAVAAIPLVLLCCFVVYLAAANTAQARRVELGMLKLRGTTAPDQWWLAAAEIVLPLLGGAVAGYAVGHAGIWLFARATVRSPGPLSVTTDAVLPALLALAAAFAAGLVALRGDLTRPVGDLLRGVPARARGWGGGAIRAVVVALTVAAVIQLRTGNGDLTGVALLAPALVILATGLVCATAFDPVVEAWGRRALRRGRLGTALALLHLGRRRSGSRVVALLVVAVGLVAFAAATAEIAATARRDQVETSIGTERVVSVRPMPMRALLTAVRAADPEGAYAMAAVPFRSRPDNLPVFVVDSPRLSQVARWPRGASEVSPDRVASVLQTGVGESVTIRGTALSLRATLDPPADYPEFAVVSMAVVYVPADGSQRLAEYFPQLRPGTHSYRVEVDCESGCRVTDLALRHNLFDPIRVTLNSLRQIGPDEELVTAADFATWVDRQEGEVEVEPSEAGLRVVVLGRTVRDAGVGPPDVPSTVPALAAGSISPIFSVGALDWNPITITTTERATALPRVGATGALVDMDLLARRNEPGPMVPGEVWLGPAAPADALDRLRAAGIGIAAEQSLDTVRAAAEERPHAVGVRFFLAVGLLCLLLGAGGLAVSAAVEMRSRAAELRALRAQGLKRRMVARAGRLSYLLIVIVGAVLGAGAGLLAWVLTGDRLPLVDVLVPGLPMPRWPGEFALMAWAWSGLALMVVGVALSVLLARRTRASLAHTTNGGRTNGGSTHERNRK